MRFKWLLLNETKCITRAFYSHIVFHYPHTVVGFIIHEHLTAIISDRTRTEVNKFV